MSAELASAARQHPLVLCPADLADEHILEIIRTRNTPVTYYVRKSLTSAYGYQGLTTPFLRRRLVKMEKAGLVRRVPSHYARDICWGVVRQEGNAS